MEPSPSRQRRLLVQSIHEESADAKTIGFAVPDEAADDYRYRPGQFLTFKLPIGGKTLSRCYSMSSAPGLDSELQITVKRVAGGRASNWICDQLRVGDTLETLPPAGVFTLPPQDRDLVLLAGGSGITPIYSILRSTLATRHARLLLLYANRDEASVIFRHQLQALVARYPQRLTVIHLLDSVQGFPDSASLGALIAPWQPQEAFICGPQPFMNACRAALEAQSLDSACIHLERFVSLPDDDAATATHIPSDGPTRTTDVALSHQGQWHQFECAENETILDAAERIKLELPHSCKAGLCASCMCQVLEGSVEMRVNEALDQRDLEKGWVLACQAVPTSDKLRLRFSE